MEPAWSTKAILDEEGLVGGLASAILGYRDSPTWLEAGAYVAYAAGMGAWYLRGIRVIGRSTERPLDA